MKEDLNLLFDLYGYAPLQLQAVHGGSKLLFREQDAISLWSLDSTPELLLRISTSKELTGVLLSPDGFKALLIFFHESRAELWDLQSLQKQGSLSGNSIEGLQWDQFSNSNCGKYIFGIDNEKLYRVPWTATGDLSLIEEIRLESEYGLGVSNYSVQPGGKHLLYALADEEAPIRKVMRKENGEWVENLAAEDTLDQIHPFEKFHFSPTGRYLHSSFRYEPVIIDTRTWEICHLSQVFGGRVQGPNVRFSEDDQQLYWRDDTIIKGLDIATGAVTAVVEDEWQILDFAWTPEVMYYSTLEERVGVYFRSRLRRQAMG